MFYFHPYLGRWSNLTNIFQVGWNHQLVVFQGVVSLQPSSGFRSQPNGWVPVPDGNSRKFLLAVIAWSPLDPNFGLKNRDPPKRPHHNKLTRWKLQIWGFHSKLGSFLVKGSKNWIFGGCSERWPCWVFVMTFWFHSNWLLGEH